jgi:HEAT repeat protein
MSRQLETEPAGDRHTRLESLLDALEWPQRYDPDVLRRRRALHVLEGIASPQAIELLRRLAAESPSRWERKTAEAAIRRLSTKR